MIKLMRSRPLRPLLLCTLLALAGCSPGVPFHVKTVQLGKSLNPDNSVGTHTTRFKPDDTVYVSLLSEEPGEGTVTARWMFGGQLVSEASKPVSYMRPAATEFHLQNSGGFPPGDYKVEVLLDGQSVGTRDFKVAR